MVDRSVTYRVRAEGAEEAGRAVDGVADSFESLSGRAEEASRSQQAFAERARESTQQSIAFTQRVSAAANAVQSLVGQLGGGSRTAGLVGALTASAAAGAQLGAAFGPGGALLGALTSALPVIAQMTGLIEDQATAHDRARRAADQQAEALDRLAERQRVIASIGRDDASDDDVARGAYAIQGDLATARADLRRVRGRGGDDAQAAARVRELERALRVASSQLQRRQERAAGAEGAELLEQMVALARDPSRRSGGGRGGESEEEALEAQYQAMLERRRDYEAQVDALKAEVDQVRRAEEDEARDLEERARQASLDAEQAASEQRIEIMEREGERLREIAEGRRAEEAEMRERQREEEIAAFDQRVEDHQHFADLATAATRSLVTTFAAIASGTEDAGQAFKGLLADFLVFISEKAILQAAAEYADAAGAFARYDYGGGAAHIAAGVAWTGVAIAAGAGAAALSAPSPPADNASARPRAEQSQGGSGGNVTYVYQLNGPTLTAQGDALLGRRLNAIGERGTRRFGLAA